MSGILEKSRLECALEFRRKVEHSSQRRCGIWSRSFMWCSTSLRVCLWLLGNCFEIVCLMLSADNSLTMPRRSMSLHELCKKPATSFMIFASICKSLWAERNSIPLNFLCSRRFMIFFQVETETNAVYSLSTTFAAEKNLKNFFRNKKWWAQRTIH